MPAPMLLALAIEMSQRDGSVALGDGTAAPETATFAAGGATDSDPLLPTIDALLRTARRSRADLGAIIVSVGPGGFTGLRIATVTAKFLAECLGIPVVAVPSALVAAAGSRAPAPRLVALASKRDSAWLTRVEGEGTEVRIVGEAGIIEATTFQPAGSRSFLADSHVPAALVEAARSAGLALEAPTFTATTLLAVGLAMLARGEISDPLHLGPVYPREPEAVTLWRERHDRHDR